MVSAGDAGQPGGADGQVGPLRGPIFEGLRVGFPVWVAECRCAEFPPTPESPRPTGRCNGTLEEDAYGFQCVRYRQARARQHFLCLRPLPHGHGSFLPTLRPECEDGMGVPDFQS